MSSRRCSCGKDKPILILGLTYIKRLPRLRRMSSSGRIRPSPENFLDPGQIREVQAGRREFLRGAFAAAVAGTTANWTPAYAGVTSTGAEGDPAILELPEHSKGLGQPVVARAYGQ